MELTNESVSRSIKACRTKAGLKQKDVAEMLNLSRTTIVKMETNPFDYKLVDLKKYADALIVPMNVFIGI